MRLRDVLWERKLVGENIISISGVANKAEMEIKDRMGW